MNVNYPKFCRDFNLHQYLNQRKFKKSEIFFARRMIKVQNTKRQKLNKTRNTKPKINPAESFSRSTAVAVVVVVSCLVVLVVDDIRTAILLHKDVCISW